MRLITSLSLSHALPIALLTLTMAGVLVSQIKMTSLIGQVRDDELGTIEQEEALHDAAWSVEIAARRGAQACAASLSVEPLLEAELAIRGRAVEAALSRTPKRREALIHAVESYAVLASRLAAGGACAQLLSERTRQEMLQIDEALTEAWILRLRELHRSMTSKEDEARRLGARATAGGVATTLLACVFAALLSRSISRTVTNPMAALAAAARRLGEGDFTAQFPVKGPTEVVQLGAELDVMRRKLGELEGLKQSFVAQVSHELRTPLTKLREALSLLNDGAAGPLSERQTRIVKIARDACEREIRMVSTLLDLSRLQAGSPLRPQSGASIDTVMRAAVQYEEPDAQPLGVKIDLQLDGDMPPMTLDAPLMERAVANLIRNAVSVSPSGKSVRIWRELQADPMGTMGVRVLVKDCGPGVPDEARPQLFQPFVTHAVEGTSHRIGVGLGLTLSREVARAHGGELELLDDTPPGALFALWLPSDHEPLRREVKPSAGRQPA